MDHPEKHCYPPSGFLANFNVEQYLAEEIRPGEGFSYKELLQFLDPFTMTATKSRYYDKVAMADWIVATSSYPPAEYCKRAVLTSSGIDSAGHLYRRISPI